MCLVTRRYPWHEGGGEAAAASPAEPRAPRGDIAARRAAHVCYLPPLADTHSSPSPPPALTLALTLALAQGQGQSLFSPSPDSTSWPLPHILSPTPHDLTLLRFDLELTEVLSSYL